MSYEYGLDSDNISNLTYTKNKTKAKFTKIS